jgi:N-acyl-L-homoserine lactone synthetase
VKCTLACEEGEQKLILEQRYAIFVKEFNFFTPMRETHNIERDQYDAYSALFGVWEKNSLVASCRLILPHSPLGLPTLKTMEIDLCKIDHSLTSAEISRISVSAEHRTLEKTTKILQIMQKELCRFALIKGIEQFIGAVEPAFLRLLKCSMLAYQPFGPLQYHIGAKRYPVFYLVQNCPSVSEASA